MIFERGFVWIRRVRACRDAAAVVTHAHMAVFVQFDFDPCGVACNGFVHRVVDDFGDHVVQGAVVVAADIHAGAFADRLQPLKHFDRGGVVGLIGRAGQKIITWHGCSGLIGCFGQYRRFRPCAAMAG